MEVRKYVYGMEELLKKKCEYIWFIGRFIENLQPKPRKCGRTFFYLCKK